MLDVYRWALHGTRIAPMGCNDLRILPQQCYGPAAPAVVFVGIDEHCEAGDAAQRDNVYLRCTSPCSPRVRASKRGALKLLSPGLRCEDVKVWPIATAVMHELRPALGGAEGSFAQELENLGEPGGDSLLTELLPLPRVGPRTAGSAATRSHSGPCFNQPRVRAPHPGALARVEETPSRIPCTATLAVRSRWLHEVGLG